MAREQWLAEINKAPLKRRAEYKRSVIEHGLDSEFVIDALAQHQKMISWMAEDLEAWRPISPATPSPTPTAAVIPYILRLELLKLGGMWAQLSGGRRLVGAHARAAFGQDHDLRSHERCRLGAVQEPVARSLAEGANLAEGG